MKYLIIFASLLSIVGCKRPPQGPPPSMPASPVGVMKVKAVPVIEWEIFSARVEAIESVALSPRVSGYLNTIHFSAGESVKKDQLLFQIDPLPYEARSEQTAALLEKAEAALATAQTEAERVPELLIARAMTQEEADARKSNFRQAQALLAAAKADHRMAQLDLDRTKVLSPINGKISRAMVTAGNPVHPSSVLTTIVSVDPVHAYADLDENTLLRCSDCRNKSPTNGKPWAWQNRHA